MIIDLYHERNQQQCPHILDDQNQHSGNIWLAKSKGLVSGRKNV
jgi:hypothetical protein